MALYRARSNRPYGSRCSPVRVRCGRGVVDERAGRIASRSLGISFGPQRRVATGRLTIALVRSRSCSRRLDLVRWSVVNLSDLLRPGTLDDASRAAQSMRGGAHMPPGVPLSDGTEEGGFSVHTGGSRRLIGPVAGVSRLRLWFGAALLLSLLLVAPAAEPASASLGTFGANRADSTQGSSVAVEQASNADVSGLTFWTDFPAM
jgi:hypothetical protein